VNILTPALSFEGKGEMPFFEGRFRGCFWETSLIAENRK